VATDAQNAAEPVDGPVLDLVTQQFDALAVAGAPIHTLSPAEARRMMAVAQSGRVFGKPVTRTERSVSDAKDQVRLQISAELVRAYNAQAHEMVDAIAAAIGNAQAGLNWLRGESPNLEEVQLALNDILSAGKRAAEIVGRLQALCVRTDCSGRGGGSWSSKSFAAFRSRVRYPSTKRPYTGARTW
jgi:hypothetical protein